MINKIWIKIKSFFGIKPKVEEVILTETKIPLETTTVNIVNVSPKKKVVVRKKTYKPKAKKK